MADISRHSTDLIVNQGDILSGPLFHPRMCRSADWAWLPHDLRQPRTPASHLLPPGDGRGRPVYFVQPAATISLVDRRALRGTLDAGRNSACARDFRKRSGALIGDRGTCRGPT